MHQRAATVKGLADEGSRPPATQVAARPSQLSQFATAPFNRTLTNGVRTLLPARSGNHELYVSAFLLGRDFFASGTVIDRFDTRRQGGVQWGTAYVSHCEACHVTLWR